MPLKISLMEKKRRENKIEKVSEMIEKQFGISQQEGKKGLIKISAMVGEEKSFHRP